MSKSFVTALVAVLFVPCLSQARQGYQPPPELYRDQGPLGRPMVLKRTASDAVTISCRERNRKVLITDSSKAPSVLERKLTVIEESVTYFITSIAPVFSGNYDTLYVFGVVDSGETVIEKWRIILSKNIQGELLHISVNRVHMFTNSAFTHLRAAAAPPVGNFLIAQKHESGEIWR